MTTKLNMLANLRLKGSLTFGMTVESFPNNPELNETVIKDGVLWIYSAILGVTTWYPFTNRKNSFVHVQAIASFQWTVRHNLGTPDVIFVIYDDSGNTMSAGSTTVDKNSFTLNFTNAVTGRVVVFAEAERYAATVDAGSLYAGSVSIANGLITGDNSGLKVNGNSVATLDGRTGTLTSSQIPYIDFAKILNTPTTINGYGITDVYTKTEFDSFFDLMANKNGDSIQYWL